MIRTFESNIARATIELISVRDNRVRYNFSIGESNDIVTYYYRFLCMHVLHQCMLFHQFSEDVKHCKLLSAKKV